jgi:DNA modification methylase
VSKLAAFTDDTASWALIEGEALATLAKLPDACVDAVVTDPPYGISFNDEAWDGADIRRVTGSESGSGDAFERWTENWARECARVLKPGGHLLAFGAPRTFHRLVAGVECSGLEVRDQLLWLYAQGMPKSRRLPGGLGTALKPAYEPILLARKPIDGRTIDTLAAFGTGALNIDAGRVGDAEHWPAHVVLSHSESCSDSACSLDCPAGEIDRASAPRRHSRLFFCAKATRAEREAGCEQLPERSATLFADPTRPLRVRRNSHPTVKPLALMRWLVALVTPPGGLVLDPFSGSGSTGAAAVLEKHRYLGIEREAGYVDIACARLTHWANRAESER